MPSWRRNRRYILILAATSGAILLLGALFRPRESKVESAAPVAQTEIARLQRLAVRNNVTEIAGYFADLAIDIEDQVLRLREANRSAVIWSSDRLVTASGPLRPPEKDAAAGRPGGELQVALLRFAPQRPAALYQAVDAPPLSNRVRYPAGYYTKGVWTLVAWRDASGELAYDLGQYLGAAEADCDGFTGTRLRLNIDLSQEMAGGAVYDANGAFMGLVASCSGQMAALDVATVEASLSAPEQVADRLAGQFGLAVSAPGEEERAALRVDDGVLIRQTWRGYQAAAAELLPGDVIVSLDGQPVTSVADLERMTLPVAREVFDLGIVRDARRRDVQVKARPTPQSSFGPSGVAWDRPESGLAIRSVNPDSRLARAGVRPGDRVLRVDGRPARDPSEIDALLSAKKRVFAVFERNGRLWGALL